MKDTELVVISTPGSVCRGSFSLLAIGETAAAVVFVWALAIWLNSTLPLLTSICIAPLLLLRSKESVDLGLTWFHRYVDGGIVSLSYTQSSPLRSVRFWRSVLLAVIVDGVATFLLVQLLNYYSTASAVLGAIAAIIIGYLGLVVALIFVAAFTARELVVAAVRRDGGIAIAVSLLVSSCAFGFASGASMLVVAILVMTKVCLAITVIFYAPQLLDTARKLALEEGQKNLDAIVIIRTVLGEVPGFFAFVRYGIYFGGWLRSILIRFFATARHPMLGLRSLPANWKRTLFVQDFMSFPEVVPGYDRKDLLNPEFVWKERETYLRSLKYWIFFVIILVPPFFYRWSIRSTFWISWSLAYVNSDPELSQHPQYLHDKLRVSTLEHLSRIIAIVSLVIFFVPLLLSASSNSAADILRSIAVSPLGLLFIIDFRDLVLVQVINVIGAVVTLAIWFSLNDFEAKIKHANDHVSIAAKMKWHARLIEIGLRLRNVTSVVFYFLFLVYAVLWLHPEVIDHLPRLVTWILARLYGHKMPVNVMDS